MSIKSSENLMITIINNMESGKEFLLRDIVDEPQSLLGRKLSEKVTRGEIANVISIGKVNGVNKYRKL